MDSDRVPMAATRTSAPETAAMRPTLGLLPVLAISAAVAAPAYGQTTEPGSAVLDTITVEGSRETPESSYRAGEGSSPRLTAPLRDTPKTVTVITQRQIEERGGSSLYDVLRTTPGVTLGTGEGGNPMGDRPFIRGYEASTDMMIDGVRSLGRTSYEAFNVESIELVKGSSGAYSGRGGTGGSLNMVSKTARVGESFTDVSVGAGTGNQFRGQLDTNFGLGNDAAARINLFWQDAEVPGRGGLRDDKLGIAAALTAHLGEATALSFGVYHSETKSTPDFGVPMANQAYLDATGDTSFGTGTPDDPFQPLGNVNHKQFFGLHERDFRNVKNQNATLRLRHEFTPSFRMDMQLTAIGGEQTYVVTRPTFELGDGTGVLQRAARSGARKNEALVFSTGFSGEAVTGPVEHAYAFGVEIGREKLRSASVTGFPGGTSDFDTPDWMNPNPNVPVDMSGLIVGPFGQATTTKSTSVYFFDTLTFNEQWQANFGLRYEKFDVFQPHATDPANDLRRKDNIWSYQAGLVYKPAPNGSIYASVSTSASPSGQCAQLAGGSEGAGACTLTTANADLAPEKTRSFEIGTKWDLFDEQLSVTAALFRTEKTNARVTDPLGNVDTIGKNRAQGLELGVAGQVNDRWALFGGYTFTDAKIIDAGFVNGEPSPTNGNQMHYIARHSFAVWSTYELTGQWTLGGGATYTGKRFVNAANTSALPGHWRIDAMASYRITDNAAVQLNVNNLFDTKLYDASHVGLFANVQAGRSTSVRLNYRF